jgi:hypothetical protein
MSYEIIAISNQALLANDDVLDSLDKVCAQPPTRAPNRAIDTR